MDVELHPGREPVAMASAPGLLRVPDSEVEQFQRGLVGRQWTARLQRLAQDAVEGLDGVRGVDGLPQLSGEFQEWSPLIEAGAPGPRDVVVLPGPLLLKLFELPGGLLDVRRGVELASSAQTARRSL